MIGFVGGKQNLHTGVGEHVCVRVHVCVSGCFNTFSLLSWLSDTSNQARISQFLAIR